MRRCGQPVSYERSALIVTNTLRRDHFDLLLPLSGVSNRLPEHWVRGAIAAHCFDTALKPSSISTLNACSSRDQRRKFTQHRYSGKAVRAAAL
jgi:hypothetical protein